MDPLELAPRLMGPAPAPSVGDEERGTGEEAPEPPEAPEEAKGGGSGLMLAEGLRLLEGCFLQSFTSAKAPRPSSLMTAYSLTPASAPISSVTMSARLVSRMAPGPSKPCCRCARCSVGLMVWWDGEKGCQVSASISRYIHPSIRPSKSGVCLSTPALLTVVDRPHVEQNIGAAAGRAVLADAAEANAAARIGRRRRDWGLREVLEGVIHEEGISRRCPAREALGGAPAGRGSGARGAGRVVGRGGGGRRCAGRR